MNAEELPLSGSSAVGSSSWNNVVATAKDRYGVIRACQLARIRSAIERGRTGPSIEVTRSHNCMTAMTPRSTRPSRRTLNTIVTSAPRTTRSNRLAVSSVARARTRSYHQMNTATAARCGNSVSS